jgi:hypothetical protein
MESGCTLLTSNLLSERSDLASSGMTPPLLEAVLAWLPIVAVAVIVVL